MTTSSSVVCVWQATILSVIALCNTFSRHSFADCKQGMASSCCKESGHGAYINKFSNSCCSVAGRDKVHWVEHVYANFQKNRGKFQSEFPWWQLGDFRSSAIDLANKATLKELCLRLFALERARQVKALSDFACTAWWRYICKR